MRALRGLVAALVVGIALAAGCGPSAESVCDKGCERYAQCFGKTQSDVTQCEIDNKCASPTKDNPDHCTTDSYNRLLSCQQGCLDNASCGNLLGCLGNCGNCIRQ